MYEMYEMYEMHEVREINLNSRKKNNIKPQFYIIIKTNEYKLANISIKIN
jgi:hypothetical protein